jgi:hypothetical protein
MIQKLIYIVNPNNLLTICERESLVKNLLIPHLKAIILMMKHTLITQMHIAFRLIQENKT